MHLPRGGHDRYTLKSDVYNFAIVILELLTWHRQFDRYSLISRHSYASIQRRCLQLTSIGNSNLLEIEEIKHRGTQSAWLRLATWHSGGGSSSDPGFESVASLRGAAGGGRSKRGGRPQHVLAWNYNSFYTC
jgi:hypothetical protein